MSYSLMMNNLLVKIGKVNNLSDFFYAKSRDSYFLALCCRMSVSNFF